MSNIPFSNLFTGRRRFDIAEMCRAVYSNPNSRSRDLIFALGDMVDEDEIKKCLEEIKGNVRSLPSSSDRIIGLASLLRSKYSQRPSNFKVYDTRGFEKTEDLSPRPTGAKGALRWAVEKYTIFHVYLKLGRKILIEYCNKDDGFRTITSKVSQLIFGRAGSGASRVEFAEGYSIRSSVYFFIGDDNEIHYRVDPPPAVIWELMRLGVPREHVNDVIRYFLAVAVAMLNPLNCYGGEPAVPILRHGSCGRPDCVQLEAKEFNLDAGRKYGESLMEKLTCTL